MGKGAAIHRLIAAQLRQWFILSSEADRFD